MSCAENKGFVGCRRVPAGGDRARSGHGRIVVETGLREMLDVQRITQVCYRYGLALDTRNWPLLATCFEGDAVAAYPGIGNEIAGYDAIEEACRNALTPLTRSQHLISNVLPVVKGAEADVTTYLQAQHVREGTP